MQQIEKLLEYQATPLRYHLAISRETPTDGSLVWNVGHSLVDFLSEEKDSEYLSEAFADQCKKLARRHTTQVESITNVLLISNYGVLFEPTLQFDVNNFIRKLSQSCLVILLSNGLIQDDRLYLSPEPSEYYISLNEINYLVL